MNGATGSLGRIPCRSSSVRRTTVFSNSNLLASACLALRARRTRLPVIKGCKSAAGGPEPRNRACPNRNGCSASTKTFFCRGTGS